MKTKIKRFSKSVLSVILAMTLIMSTMLIGTISVNATISGLSALYFTPDTEWWGTSNAKFRLKVTTSDGTSEVDFQLVDSENSIYKATLDSSTTYTKFQFIRYNSDYTSQWNTSGEFSSVPAGKNYFTKTTNWQNTWDPINGNDGTTHGTWSTYDSGSGSGGSESNTELYVLSKYSSDVKLYTYSRNNFTPKDSSLTNNDHLPMNMVASFQNGSNTYYLWKVSYTGTCKFIVYCKSDSESGNWYDKKLTSDVDGSSYTTTSYYFDLKDVDKTNSPTVNSATTPFKSLESAEFSSAATSFEAGIVNLTTEFPVASATNTLSAYNTVSYYVDDSLVSDPTSWNATAGNHSVYAVINSGTKSGETGAYQSAQTDTKNFTVTSATTTYTVTYGKVGSGTVTAKNGDTQISDNPATVDANTTVTFTADADTGYQFDGWYSDEACSDSNKLSDTSPYAPTIKADTTVYAKFTAINYTVTYGTGGTGSGSVTAKKDGTTDIGTSPASVAYNSSVTFTAKAASGSQFSGWYSDADCTYAISGATQSSTEYTATITANTNVYAKFIPEESPSQNYFLFHSDKTDNKYTPIYDKMTESNGSYSITTTAFMLNNDNKFKITNSDASGSADNANNSVGYGVDPASPNYTITVGPLAKAAGITVVNLGSSYYDFQIQNNNTGRTDFVIKYTPLGTIGLNGTIYVEFASSTPTLATPKIKGDSSALPGSTITVALDNQKDFGTDKDGNGKYTSDYENLTFTYTVTASDGSKPEVTSTASGKILASDGTTAINDKISFTASATEGVTYTITCKVSAKGFDDVPSSELTVKVGTIPYAQANRIYAYAKTLGANETPALNAWVASESKVDAINTHNDSTDGQSIPEGNKVEPTLGKTSDTDIRIFLPTTASSSKVVLYNSFSTSITVNGTEIQSGKYAEVSYTPNKEYTISNGKKLTIYKSTADGALYVNNTGDYASIDNNGALSMINKLYSDKEKGEIAAGNAGALADSNGVKDVAVKKIKGRGNSTWVSANKKSFNVTFTDNINAFGFKQGKKFSLLANFKDPSLSRNKILYELADLMGVKYSPDAATVDLYMNGLYMGSYLMCQKVEVGSKELVDDLGKTLLEDLYTDSATKKVPVSAAETIKSSGFSFLMELDSNAGTGDFYITVDTQNITIKEPEYLNDDGSIPEDVVTKAAQEFVKTKYTELNTAMSNTSITLADLNKIIDVESLAKYYLINEIAKNYDIGVSSTYLVYNYTKGKFYISPLWDMDVTTGNCKYTESDYQSYEGNWTDNNSSSNYFMKKVMANPQVQSAARKLWTGSYYTTLTNYIDTLTTKATSVEGSLNCNYIKWNYPYGFQGKYKDNVKALTSLNVATYNPSDNTYTVASSSTSYDTTAVGQTQYVSDWLKSRVAWMSKKYNTYYLTGDFASSWGSAYTMANNSGVNTYAVENISSGDHIFKICTDGGLSTDTENGTVYRDWSATSISYNADLNLVSDTSKITNLAVESSRNNITFTTSEAMTVYFTFNQKTNTLTLSDKQSTSTNPSVKLSGSEVPKNEDIKDGTAVTLTATITPATNNNVVVTGDYTAKLYIGERVVNTEKVNFTDTDVSKVVTFSTFLEGTNQTYKVVVTCNDGEQDRTGTSNTVTYKQTGVKDQKIYFDPSTHTATVGSNTVYDWLDATNKDSVVTVTLSDSTTFKMYIDSDDVHGLDKGVFRADIDEDTLEKLKNDSNITFSMDGTSLTCSVAGQSDITSGWIYNYSSQTGQALWEQYNVSYEEAYPSSRTDSKYANITTFAQFKDYIKDQKALKDAGQATDNIVYFDNSVSKWYNVYIYGWEQSTGSPLTDTQATIMKKLPYADIWYYDFGTAEVKSNFLFKDRSGPGFGNNYQETVDLVNGYIKNGDGAEVQLFFEKTLTDSANPIFVTQNFYNSTIKRASDGTYDETLKYRAFNTQWDEFATILSNTVQTKAVDVYFDLHDKATDVANIQLYHTSTNSNYKFVSEFTRLTQMPGSTIFHASIMLPYTDNGIAFKFERFVVNYSGGKKTCEMSANVQPEFTCINTGEVWYEINSDFNGVGYDTAVSSASLLTTNSPSLTAATEYKDVYLTGNMNGWSTNDSDWQLSSTDGNKYTRTFVYDGSKGDIEFKVYFALDSAPIKYFTKEGGSGNFTFNSSTTFAQNLINPDGNGNHMKIEPISKTGQVLLNVTVYKSYDDGNSQNVKRLEITQSVVKDYYVADDPIKESPFTGSEAKMSKNDSGVYYYHFTDIAAGDYNFKITDGSSNWDVANVNNYSAEKSSLTNITVSNPNSWNKIKVSLSSTTSFTVYYDETNVYIIEDSSTPTPTISLSAASNNLTLVDGVATTALTATTTNPDDATVTYTVDQSSGWEITPDADTHTATFKATAAGTYVVTASITVNGTTYPKSVTIKVADEVTKDYCGVLAYNHSTATFDVTGGGTIDKTDVVLKNGYYDNSVDGIKTGYTSYDGTTYTVIYALPSTASSGATTSYSSTTSHSNEGTGEGKYSFDGWTKDGVISTESKTLSDSISGIATVAYIANWSKEVMVTYTFTYVYDMYDISQNGKEYHEDGAVTTNSDYKVQVSLSESATEADVIAAYLANAPKISSDYFTYTFNDTNVAITVDLNNHTAEATAKIASVKKYKVTFNDEDGIVSADEYFYQNIVTLTQSAPSGYVTVWKDEKGNTLYVGDSYSFRITRNIIIESKSVTSSSIKPATYVNEPTYEFFTTGTTEYVKFKVRVDNVLAGVSPYEYGTLYFFTDENGVPVDSTISVDSNIDSDKLTAAALGSASTGIKKYDATDIKNADHKFIYAPYIKNTAANRDRYLRVYSYYIYKDKEGNDVVVISSDSVLASIRNALNES